MNLNYSLARHPKAYELSWGEAMAFPVISPYAKRHWDLSENGPAQCRLGHRVIALVEYIPLVGALASLIERITVYAANFFNNLQKQNRAPDNSRPNINVRPAPKIDKTKVESSKKVDVGSPMEVKPQKNSEKMLKNFFKAVKEHKKEEALKGVDLSIDEAPQPLTFKVDDHETQGLRRNMEDAHFHQNLEQGLLLGVFDGHGDNGLVAALAKDDFQNNFAAELAKNPDDIRMAFTTVINQIHAKVREQQLRGGSTAVISFIDKKTNIIYTATLADSEAKIYRKVSDKIAVIPLSCVRDWSHPREAKRASVALNAPAIAEDWPKETNPKYLRFVGINVSRTIGDLGLTLINDKPGLIQKPKITMQQMKPGDLLIVGCDGLWDYTKEDELIEKVIAPAFENHAEGVAKKACELSVAGQYSSGDNVTVIAVMAL